MGFSSSDLPRHRTALAHDHDASGNYRQCEMVLYLGSLYRANSDINGTDTPVAFVEGSGANEWTKVN